MVIQTSHHVPRSMPVRRAAVLACYEVRRCLRVHPKPEERPTIRDLERDIAWVPAVRKEYVRVFRTAFAMTLQGPPTNGHPDATFPKMMSPKWPT